MSWLTRISRVIIQKRVLICLMISLFLFHEMYCVTMVFLLYKGKHFSGEEMQTYLSLPRHNTYPAGMCLSFAWLCGNCWEACWSSPVSKEIAAWGPAEHTRYVFPLFYTDTLSKSKYRVCLLTQVAHKQSTAPIHFQTSTVMTSITLDSTIAVIYFLVTAWCFLSFKTLTWSWGCFTRPVAITRWKTYTAVGNSLNTTAVT